MEAIDRSAGLCLCNSSLTRSENDVGGTGLKLDFLSGDTSSEFNGLFTRTDLRGMLKGKDNRTLDMVFPFVEGFINCVTGHVKQASVKRLHTLYPDLISSLPRYNSVEATDDVRRGELSRHIKEFKRLPKAMLDKSCETGLYTPECHLLNHLVNHLNQFECLQISYASPFERFNVHIKRAYKTTCQR